MATKTIAYLRVSTDKQADRGVSLDAQRVKVAAYAELYDLELVEVVVDAGESAKSLDRPGLQRALEMLKRGEAEALLVVKLGPSDPQRGGPGLAGRAVLRARQGGADERGRADRQTRSRGLCFLRVEGGNTCRVAGCTPRPASECSSERLSAACSSRPGRSWRERASWAGNGSTR